MEGMTLRPNLGINDRYNGITPRHRPEPQGAEQ